MKFNRSTANIQDYPDFSDAETLMSNVFKARGRAANLIFVSPLTFENKKLTKNIVINGEKMPNPMCEYVNAKGVNGSWAKFPKLYKKTEYIFKIGIDYKKLRAQEASMHNDTYTPSMKSFGKHNVPGWEGILKQNDNDPSVYYIVIDFNDGKPQTQYMMFDDASGAYRNVDISEVTDYLPVRKAGTWADGSEKKMGYVEAKLNNVLIIKTEKTYFYNNALLQTVPEDVKNLIENSFVA
jgi:hypothetical protein